MADRSLLVQESSDHQRIQPLHWFGYESVSYFAFPVLFLSQQLGIFLSFVDGLLTDFVSGIQMETRRDQDRQRY